MQFDEEIKELRKDLRNTEDPEEIEIINEQISNILNQKKLLKSKSYNKKCNFRDFAI